MKSTPLQKDILSIKELQSECILGCYEWERKAARPVLINLDIAVSPLAGKTDDLAETLDYAELIQQLDKFIRKSQFKLIEALAEHIAEFVLKHFTCQQVRVELIKPNVIKQVKQISISIERQR
ncbi:MAG: putative dihydroneopterin aldolase [Gammaproteobacteria bacterium]|jgi:dihydroneopterin aldolase|nr:putative dihydroneopterin aldolase [Gammaproteobacteria bacterium]